MISEKLVAVPTGPLRGNCPPCALRPLGGYLGGTVDVRSQTGLSQLKDGDYHLNQSVSPVPYPS